MIVLLVFPGGGQGGDFTFLVLFFFLFFLFIVNALPAIQQGDPVMMSLLGDEKSISLPTRLTSVKNRSEEGAQHPSQYEMRCLIVVPIPFHDIKR